MKSGIINASDEGDIVLNGVLCTTKAMTDMQSHGLSVSKVQQLCLNLPKSSQTRLQMHAGDEGIVALEEVLCTTKAMTSLVLAHTKLTEHSGPVLGRLIEFVPKLAHLDVSWNQLGPLTAEALAGGLVPGGHLVSLDVSWNGLEAQAGLIAAALQKGGGAPLRILNLSGTRPSDEVTNPPFHFLRYS